MPMIRKAKGIYALYKGKPKKSIRNSEITGYYINYRNSQGKPIKERVEATTIAEAQVLLKQRIVERDRTLEENPTAKSMSFKKETISTIAAKYFDTRGNTNGRKDRMSYEKHLDDQVGEAKLIRPMDVKLLQNKLSAKGLANKTVNTYTDMLRTILNFGVNNGFLRGDAYIMKAYKKLDVDNIVEKYLNPNQVREMFEKALWSDKRLRGETEPLDYEIPYQKYRLQFYLKTLYYTGQRPISVLRLQKKDVIGNQVEGYKINIISVKKQRQHYVPVSSEYISDLLKYIQPLQPNDYIFHSERTPSERTPSKPITTYTMIEQGKPLFNHYNQGLSFKEDRKYWVSFYTMRHSAATNILASTGSEKYAGTLLNHSDPRMTQRYVKVLDSAMQEAVDGL